MFIIGIAGGTGSGKTTVVKKLLERLPKSKVALMPQDSYYNDGNDVPIEERQKVNYDHPNAFDWALLRQQLSDLQNGKTIEQPVYDYITSSRQKETITITPKPIILVEGIMALYDPEIRESMNLKIFVDADADDRLIRVIYRDIVERNRTVEDVIKRYQEVLKPMHQQFIEPCKRYADIIVPQGGHNAKAIDTVARSIIQHINENK
ncbi:MAG: uridine kinase [Paludibacteraceae bacterium]|nr:uridine kinase [Paludibacteraceae bacterium]